MAEAPAVPEASSVAAQQDAAEHEAALAAALTALGADRPAAAARTRLLLDHLLTDIRAAPCPPWAWQAGLLTADGYPVEFGFTTADEDIRITVDPWPDVAPPDRLARALRSVEAVSGTALDPLGLAGLQPVGAPLRYGAWIGGRLASDPARDRLKVYVEVAPDAVLANLPDYGDLRVEARIEAWEPASGRRERYLRGRHLQLHHLARLLDGLGLGQRYAEVRDCLERAYGHPMTTAVPGGAAGWSVAQAPGQPAVLTVFLFAAALWGEDTRIAQQALEFCRQQGLRLPGYPRTIASLCPRHNVPPCHGMVGFVVAPGQPLHLALGLRPPPRIAGEDHGRR